MNSRPEALARYYDSRTGTFCSADPLAGSPGDPQSWNRYPYGRNDPIDITDPSGKNWLFSLVQDIMLGLAPFTAGATLPAAFDFGLLNGFSNLVNGQPPWGFGSFGGGVSLGSSWNGTPIMPYGGLTGGIQNAAGLPTMADVGGPINNLTPAPSNGTTTCVGPGFASAVGPRQAPYTGHSGALYSKTQQYSIAGGAMGTVAVPPKFLGLSKASLRQYGNSIFISFADNGEIANSGGPAGPYTVSDIGDINIRNSRIDIYRWPGPGNKAANAFGKRPYTTTITFPTASGGSCPQGWATK